MSVDNGDGGKLVAVSFNNKTETFIEGTGVQVKKGLKMAYNKIN